jgi:hypothetical protein
MDEKELIKYLKENKGIEVTKQDLDMVYKDVMNDIWCNKILYSQNVSIDYVADILITHINLFKRLSI